ncbi:MAG: peptide chain release factor N(5)-glutamine methyltransferase [Bacillota bacterium]
MTAWCVREVLAWATRWLERCGVAGAATDAAILLGEVLGTDRAGVYAQGDREVTPEQLRAFWRLVRRRARREPLAYITGRRDFMSLGFLVDRRVLIPRPETEILIEEALARLRGYAAGPASRCGGAGGGTADGAGGGTVRVADVGTGSGAIAVSLAYYLPGCRVVASDVSPGALEVARENARRHGVAGRVTFVEGDGPEPLRPWAPYAAILCNPPYVGEGEEVDPEVRYEPREAWFAGPDPLDPYRKLVAAVELLEPGGFLAVEVGAGRAPAVVEVFARYLVDMAVREDLAGIPRVVVGHAPVHPRGRECASGGCP